MGRGQRYIGYFLVSEIIRAGDIDDFDERSMVSLRELADVRQRN